MQDILDADRRLQDTIDTPWQDSAISVGIEQRLTTQSVSWIEHQTIEEISQARGTAHAGRVLTFFLSRSWPPRRSACHAGDHSCIGDMMLCVCNML